MKLAWCVLFLSRTHLVVLVMVGIIFLQSGRKGQAGVEGENFLALGRLGYEDITMLVRGKKIEGQRTNHPYVKRNISY